MSDLPGQEEGGRVRVEVRLRRDLLAQLKEESHRQVLSLSRVVERAVREFLDGLPP